MRGTRRFRHPSLLVAALGGLLAVLLSPARADIFDHTLLVGGRSGTVEVTKTTVRVAWTGLPARDPDEGNRSWQLRVGTRFISCSSSDSTARVGPITNISTRSGSHDLDLSGPDFHVGSTYFVRACLPLFSGSHASNQIEVRVVAPVAAGGIHAPLPGSPQITGFLGPTPVRPGYWLGVKGLSLGDRPGRLSLRILGRQYPVSVSASDWKPGAIAGQLDRTIFGAPDGPAFLVVERADGARSAEWSVPFAARREVLLVLGGELAIDACSDAGDSNWCESPRYPDAPSLAAYHGSIHTFGESGTDQFSISLLNGWRFHDLEFSYGEGDMPRPTWSNRGTPTYPRIQFNWRNPSGWSVSHHYGYRLYIIGPAGVPHR